MIKIMRMIDKRCWNSMLTLINCMDNYALNEFHFKDNFRQVVGCI